MGNSVYERLVWGYYNLLIRKVIREKTMPDSQEARFTEGTVASVRMGLKIITYPQQLLELAGELIKEEQRHRYSLAVIVAHIACEVAVERVIAQFTNGAPENAGMIGYSLRGDNNRKKYTALTGDSIQQGTAFWQKYKESVKWRNYIMHKHKVATLKEAEESHKAATAFVGYLEQKFRI